MNNKHALLILLALPLLPGCGGGGGGSSSPAPTPGAFTLMATAGDASNTLAWTTPTISGSQITGYDIKRATDPNAIPATVVASVGPAVNAFTDSPATDMLGVTVGTTYYYKITAHAANGTTMDSATPPPAPSPTPAAGKTLAYSDSATPGGPQASGLGDPSVCNGPCTPPDAVFQGTSYAYSTSIATPATASFVLDITLNRAATSADLQSAQIKGTVYTRANTPGFATGITVPSPATPGNPNSLRFDSAAAGITLPAAYQTLTPGGFSSLTATVADKGLLKRLEFTADAPPVTAAQPTGNNSRTITIGAPDNRVFGMTVTAGP